MLHSLCYVVPKEIPGLSLITPVEIQEAYKNLKLNNYPAFEHYEDAQAFIDSMDHGEIFKIVIVHNVGRGVEYPGKKSVEPVNIDNNVIASVIRGVLISFASQLVLNNKPIVVSNLHDHKPLMDEVEKFLESWFIPKVTADMEWMGAFSAEEWYKARDNMKDPESQDNQKEMEFEEYTFESNEVPVILPDVTEEKTVTINSFIGEGVNLTNFNPDENVPSVWKGKIDFSE